MRIFNWSVIVFCIALLLSACDESAKKTNDKDNLSDSDELIGDSDENAVSDMDFAATCGNGFIDGGEPCDGNTELCSTIDPALYNGGKAKCRPDCTGWDTVTCDEVPHECGNFIQEGPEACDGDTKDCVDIDAEKYGAGKAKCLEDCSDYDTATCDAAEPHECGNAIVEGPEICDGGLINCVEIDPFVYASGKAKCNDSCDGWDTATCEELPKDGDTLPDTDAVCSNDCTPQGTERCVVDTVQRCTQGGDGCNHWQDMEYCDQYSPAQTCELSFGDAYCVSSCTSECTSGDRRCNPTYADQVDDCTLDNDGCYYWTYMEDCATWGMVCVDPGTAGCDYPSTAQTDTIGSNAYYYTGGDRLKGNYFSCSSSRTLTEIETYMSFLGSLDITYAVYYSSSQTGTYSLLSQTTVNHYSSAGSAAFYSSGALSVSLTSGYYYFIGVFFGVTDDMVSYDPTHYYDSSLETDQPAFGTHLGGGETSPSGTFASLPSTITTIDNSYSYYMRLTSE
ncbi:MAG TPA: hypothetical protein PLV42_08810 [bacterium]|nr:hypothetical protein [bacterium]